MKAKILSMASIFILTFAACKKDKDDKDEKTKVNNVIVSSSECKSNIVRLDSLSNHSCIVYSYDESSQKLSLTHVDAAFNCCPGELSCEVTFNVDTIIFTEKESKAECNCDCLYDLNIEVSNLSKRAYFLKFVEPYIGNMEKLEFGVNFAEQDSGTYCVTREMYPWGI